MFMFTVSLWGFWVWDREFFVLFCNFSISLKLFQRLIDTTCMKLKTTVRSCSV